MFPLAAGARSRALLALALLASAAHSAREAPSSRQAAAEPERASMPIGINLRPITPFDRAWVFTDAMKAASEWRYDVDGEHPRRSKDGEEPEPVPLDAAGWPQPPPGRPVSCQFFVGMRGLFPSGDYVVTWKGTGTLEFRGHAGVVDQRPRRLVVRLDGLHGGQPGLVVRDVDAADPVRDIRVWLPGQERSVGTFHPLFLERLRPFTVLRFYPWMRVYTASGRWSERSTPASARQSTPQGVALEYMVELCNELEADPWFCMPHLADDDYVRRFAALVRDTLRPEARVYVEFSNETWNTDFAAGQWAREEARRRGVPATQVVGERAAQVFDLWHEAFGRGRPRIVRVAGAQLHDPGVARGLCRALDGRLDALGVGAYFGARADHDLVDSGSSAAELMAVARANIDELVLPRVREHLKLVDQLSVELGRPIALVAYEGGQSIVARSPGGGLDLEATLECQRMPEMYHAYRALLDGLEAQGLALFVAYDFAGPRSAADTYSVLESMQEPLESAVKYRALVESRGARGR